MISQKFCHVISQQVKIAKRPISDYNQFQKVLNQARSIVALTGAGVSAESGITVFRGAGGLWRSHRATDLATPTAFRANPALVWEFYHYRRDVAFNSQPNKAHKALAKYEKICKEQGRNFHVITQNVDGLHRRAGSENVLELHGSLDKVICTKCKQIEVNEENPICEALRGRGDPSKRDQDHPIIPLEALPKCSKCQALVRPYIVWFGENLDPEVLDRSRQLIESCDLCLVIGTSSVVYPAAMFAPTVVERGKPVAEFNLNEDAFDDAFSFYFSGPCGVTLPKALGIDVKG
ncbi:NAD-dependent protein deacylase-like [Tribolium madens]|uniref:NAD-dependent protein deacylase-like n=1 Tax=Tribolium madens TaxID=41895 RepID=UPI001CF75C5C|nr:NAD-dependent protein deacylase-like [Tribolium madens]XP_044256613.1 NAD-dependent protein deacylase-like [Tribolium madens]